MQAIEGALPPESAPRCRGRENVHDRGSMPKAELAGLVQKLRNPHCQQVNTARIWALISSRACRQKKPRRSGAKDLAVPYLAGGSWVWVDAGALSGLPPGMWGLPS